MTPPTTLPALRAALARVLVARGESAEALYVDRDQWGVCIGVTVCGAGVEWIYAVAPTCREAVAKAWASVERELRDEYVSAHRSWAACRSQATRDRARARLRRARAACEAAGVGGGDYRDV